MHRRARHLNARHAGAGLVLDARRISGLNDGDAVSTWSDASGNGWDATGISTSRPLYKTAIQGGQPVLRFDGTDDEMDVLSAGALAYSKNVAGFTIISIVKDSSSGGDVNHILIIFSTTSVSSSRAAVFTKATSSGLFSVARRLDADSATVTASAGASSSFCVVRGSFKYSSGAVLCARNATETATSALSGSSNTSNTNSSNITIGATVSGAFNRLSGDVGCIIAINATPTASLVKRLEHSASFSFKIQCS